MLTMSSALGRAHRMFGDRTAFVDHHRTLTWSAFVHRATNVLLNLGVSRGESFAILSLWQGSGCGCGSRARRGPDAQLPASPSDGWTNAEEPAACLAGWHYL
jgi:hypothetical protein